MNTNVLKIGIVALFVTFGIATQSCTGCKSCKKNNEPTDSLKMDTIAEVIVDTVTAKGDSVVATGVVETAPETEVKAVEKEKIEEIKK